MAISFVHTADLQIGKGFNSVNNEAAVILKRQRINTVRRIAELATNRKVDAVLVAGDVFDFDTVSNETVHALLQAMEPYSGPWVMIPGNHDPALPESVWKRVETLGPPANLLVSLKPELISLAGGQLAIMTAPLRRRREGRDLTDAWNAFSTTVGMVRVGLAHGAITTQVPAGLEASNPIAGDCEVSSRLDYLALGDWHGTLQVTERTWYSGTPETDRFKDNDSGNVLIVTIPGPRAVPEVEKVQIGRFRWCEREFTVSRPEDLAALDGMLRRVGEPFEERVMSLLLNGTIDLDMREQLDCLLEAWRGRLLYLREHCDNLIATPTDADLDRIDTGGFVRAAVDRLRRMQADASDPDHRYATDAIALLHRIHTGAGPQ